MKVFKTDLILMIINRSFIMDNMGIRFLQSEDNGDPYQGTIVYNGDINFRFYVHDITQLCGTTSVVDKYKKFLIALRNGDPCELSFYNKRGLTLISTARGEITFTLIYNTIFESKVSVPISGEAIIAFSDMALYAKSLLN